jgi:peroxiredoxin Q/BCP
VGGKVPDFALNDQDGKRVALSDLLGVPFVLYFYPKDDTAGCTKEACDFQDQFSAFKRLGCRVVGVSPDSEASHKKFANKYGLDFTLLSDPEKTLCSALGVWQLKKNYGREYMGVVRSTFVIQSDGVIVRAFRAAKVAGHVPRVLEALKGVS